MIGTLGEVGLAPQSWKKNHHVYPYRILSAGGIANPTGTGRPADARICPNAGPQVLVAQATATASIVFCFDRNRTAALKLFRSYITFKSPTEQTIMADPTLHLTPWVRYYRDLAQKDGPYHDLDEQAFSYLDNIMSKSYLDNESRFLMEVNLSPSPASIDEWITLSLIRV